MQIKGIHHYSMKCNTPEAMLAVRRFYTELLGMTVVREWETGLMIDSGSGLIEVFSNGTGSRECGAIRHIAFAVDDAAAYAQKAAAAGYEVFLGPKEIEIPTPAVIAFCYGPLGEQVEFFQPL